MAKLYPPNIEGSIPAFYGTALTVPFSMNRSVGRQEVKGITLKVKTVQSNSFLFEVPEGVIKWGGTNPSVVFDLSGYIGKLNAGQFYKIQIAYVDTYGVVGYYSTVGVVKYTDRPSITIEGLDTLKINNFNHSFVGVYTPGDDDPTEKEYSYRFIITDSADNIVEDSGTRVHRSDNDTTANQSSDEWECLNDLSDSGIHYIQYIVNTVNNIQLKTYKYKILARNNASMDIPITLTATLDFDNGYVNLTAENNPPTAVLPITGGFVLTRLDTSNPTVWVEIQRQNLQSVLPSEMNFRDFTIEQGKTYIYGLQQYNDNGLYSERITSNAIYADFEHAFLFDGVRQLKIEYNPKVTSFKVDVLESKIDTIGSQFPFIFRNGAVYYKEFPISGLISYWSDDEELFMTKGEMRLIANKDHRTQTAADILDYTSSAQSHQEVDAWDEIGPVRHTPSKSLVNYNIAAERWFKLTVLDWLNNGKPKLFRSPAEGNYIVRLLNTSLSPNDTVGRMLHTFQSQAYEVEKYSYEKLKEYGLTQRNDFVDTVPKWSTVSVSDFKKRDDDENFILDENGQVIIEGTGSNWLSKLNNSASGCNEVNLYDFVPGTIIEIKLSTSSLPTQIKIGSTGNYHFKSDDIITSITYPEQIAITDGSGNAVSFIDNIETWRNQNASIVFSYEEPVENIFALIEDSIVDEAQVRQVYGQYIDVEYDNNMPNYKYFNLFWALQDYLPSASRADTDLFRTSIWRLLELRFDKREMEPLYFNVKKYLWEEVHRNENYYNLSEEEFFNLVAEEWEDPDKGLSIINTFINNYNVAITKEQRVSNNLPYYYLYNNRVYLEKDVKQYAISRDKDLANINEWKSELKNITAANIEGIIHVPADHNLDDAHTVGFFRVSRIGNSFNYAFELLMNEKYKYPLLNARIRPYLYLDRELTKPMASDGSNLNPAVLYKIILMAHPNNINQQLYFEEDERLHKITDVYIDGQSFEVCLEQDYSTKVYIDIGAADYGRNAYNYDEWDTMVAYYKNKDTADLPNPANDNVQILDLEDTDEIIIKHAFPEHDFFTGIGVTTTAVFMLKTVVYNIENMETKQTYKKKRKWGGLVDRYSANIAATGESLNPSEAQVNAAYEDYIETLDKELTDWLVENGRL